MDPIINFAKKHKIKIIEIVPKHMELCKNKPVGSYGDISTWSFCQDKIMSTGGEGGMISTNNKNIWEKCWSIKDHGKNYYIVHNKKINWVSNGFTIILEAIIE